MDLSASAQLPTRGSLAAPAAPRSRHAPLPASRALDARARSGAPLARAPVRAPAGLPFGAARPSRAAGLSRCDHGPRPRAAALAGALLAHAARALWARVAVRARAARRRRDRGLGVDEARRDRAARRARLA